LTGAKFMLAIGLDVRGLLSGDVTVARNAVLQHVEKIELRPCGSYARSKGPAIAWCAISLGVRKRFGFGGEIP